MILVPWGSYFEISAVRSDLKASPKSCGRATKRGADACRRAPKAPVRGTDLQLARHVLGRLIVVDVIEHERHGDGEDQAERDADRPGPALSIRALRDFGVVHQPDVVRAAVARTRSSFSRWSSDCYLAVAVRLALHQVVVDALLAEVLRVRFAAFRFCVRLLFQNRCFVIVLDRLCGTGDLELATRSASWTFATAFR